jgi:hypothetical protein
MMEETWKEIEGKAGFFVSDKGRIKRVQGDKEVIRRLSILKIGYPAVTIYADGKHKTFYVHRMVAEAFLPNPHNYRCVNHIDGNKANNALSNLEWCSHSMNHIHAYSTGLREAAFKGKSGKDHNRSVPVIAMDLQGNTIGRFESLSIAASELKVNVGGIKGCCDGDRRRVGNYKFCYDK